MPRVREFLHYDANFILRKNAADGTGENGTSRVLDVSACLSYQLHVGGGSAFLFMTPERRDVRLSEIRDSLRMS